MIVLDTHIWLWLVAEPVRLSSVASAVVDEADRIGVSAISCWEVAMLAAKQRIRLDRPVVDWLEDALLRPRVELLAITPAVAALAAEIEAHGDPADRLIVATALTHEATLVTKDATIRASSLIDTIW